MPGRVLRTEYYRDEPNRCGPNAPELHLKQTFSVAGQGINKAGFPGTTRQVCLSSSKVLNMNDDNM